MSEETTFTDSALSDKVKQFLNSFKDNDGNYKYIDRIDTMFGGNKTSFTLDIIDILGERDLEKILMQNPSRFLYSFNRAGKEILQIRFPDYAQTIADEFNVRLSGYPIENSFEQINSKSIGKMVKIKGMVKTISTIISRPKKLVYVCPDEHPTTIIVSFNEASDDIKTPIVCENPSCKYRDFELKPDASIFVDFQTMRIEEPTEDLPPGHRPQALEIDIVGDLVNFAKPGDRVKLTGMSRIVKKLANSKINRAYEFERKILTNNIEYQEGRNSLSISDSEKKQFHTMAENSDFIKRLIGGFAPHIVGNDLIKESMIYGMVSGEEVDLGLGMRKRGDIHEFVVGDPAGAKSELLKFAAKIAPRGFYTTGRGTSGPGLTAAVVQNSNGMWILEAGPMVLADKGIVACDEFDKMNPDDRGNMHEAMEQQTFSIAKGGIVTTLNCRTTVFAGANPSKGKWDPHNSFLDNMKGFPLSLITRFDLIFVVRDIPDREKDTKIAQRIFDLYSEKRLHALPIEPEMMTKFFTYAKSRPPIELTKSLKERIVRYYVETRQKTDPDLVGITTRQLEGIIRISVACARAKLSDSVTDEDVERAIKLVEESARQTGSDPNSSNVDKVDMGVLNGVPAVSIQKEKLWSEILKIFDGFTEIPIKECKEKMLEMGVWRDEEDADMWIKGKFNNREISGTKQGYFRERL